MQLAPIKMVLFIVRAVLGIQEMVQSVQVSFKLLFKDYESSFETLLTRSGISSMHTRNLQKLMTEIYKSMNRLNPSLVREFHEKKLITHNLRIQACASYQQLRHVALDSIHCLFEVVPMEHSR